MVRRRIPVYSDDPRLGRAYIGDPPPVYSADITALHVTSPLMRLDTTGGALRFDPRNAEFSLFFVLGKTAGANEVILDVTTGGTSGWTTPGGLNQDYTLPGSDLGVPATWMLHVDHRHLTISIVPVDGGTLEGLYESPITETADTRTMSSADYNAMVVCTHASGCEVTIPAGLQPGATVEYVQGDADSAVSLVAGGGMVLRYPATFSPETNEQWSSLVVTIIDSTHALVRGDLAAA